MARPLRVEHTDTYYHVLARGNERRAIFKGKRDHERFLELLGEVSGRFGLEVWSYVLMVNHYHLVVRTRLANLSRAMQWLGVSYAAWFNAKHRRVGHLFQGRFKSFVIEEGDYLKRLILYVHRNPLRAGLVTRLADYPWSSYRQLAYGLTCPVWLARGAVLAAFGGTPKSFRQAVQAYSEEKDRLFEDLRHGLVLGSAYAVRRLQSKIKEASHPEKPQSRVVDVQPEIGETARLVLRAMSLPADTLDQWRGGTRGSTFPHRDAFVYVLWRLSPFTARAIADLLGVTSAAIVYARRRGQRVLTSDRKLRIRLEKNLTFKM